ncbi:MAG: hypothetical protein LBQ80_05805 [Clostridium sp.]|jgi:hypothetical protein|nr:hypothetical protein [Clostridium sp.]
MKRTLRKLPRRTLGLLLSILMVLSAVVCVVPLLALPAVLKDDAVAATPDAAAQLNLKIAAALARAMDSMTWTKLAYSVYPAQGAETSDGASATKTAGTNYTPKLIYQALKGTTVAGATAAQVQAILQAATGANDSTADTGTTPLAAYSESSTRYYAKTGASPSYPNYPTVSSQNGGSYSAGPYTAVDIITTVSDWTTLTDTIDTAASMSVGPTSALQQQWYWWRYVGLLNYRVRGGRASGITMSERPTASVTTTNIKGIKDALTTWKTNTANYDQVDTSDEIEALVGDYVINGETTLWDIRTELNAAKTAITGATGVAASERDTLLGHFFGSANYTNVDAAITNLNNAITKAARIENLYNYYKYFQGATGVLTATTPSNTAAFNFTPNLSDQWPLAQDVNAGLIDGFTATTDVNGDVVTTGFTAAINNFTANYTNGYNSATYSAQDRTDLDTYLTDNSLATADTTAWVNYNTNMVKVLSLCSFAILEPDIRAMVNDYAEITAAEISALPPAQQSDYSVNSEFNFHYYPETETDENSWWGANWDLPYPAGTPVADQDKYVSTNQIGVLSLQANTYQAVLNGLGSDVGTLFPFYLKMSSIYNRLNAEVQYRKVHEATWYSLRNDFLSMGITAAQAKLANDATLISNFAAADAKYTEYKTAKAAAYADSKMTAELNQEIWYIYDSVNSAWISYEDYYIMPNVLGSNGGELASRFAEQVSNAMSVYFDLEASNLIQFTDGTIRVSPTNAAPLLMAINAIKASLYNGLLNTTYREEYINAITPLTAPTLFGAPYTDVARNVINDYLFLLNKVKPLVQDYENNPEKYWITNNADSPAGSGNYVDRTPKADDLVDNHEYLVTEDKINDVVAKLDDLLGSNGDVKAIFDLLKVDTSNPESMLYGVDTTNVSTILQGILENQLYSNKMVNTLMLFLYPLVLAKFEDAFSGIASPSLLEGNDGLTLEIFNLHDILANKAKAALNTNTIQDLRLYPDLVADAMGSSEFPAIYNALKKLGPDNFTLAGGGTYTAQAPYTDLHGSLFVKSNAQGGVSGYVPGTINKANGGIWHDSSIWTPTIDSLGRQVYTTDPLNPPPAGVTEYDYANPSNPNNAYFQKAGELVFDWGIDSLAGSTRVAQFKKALAAALSGLLPLLKTMMAGTEYYAFHDNIGSLTGSVKQGDFTIPFNLNAMYSPMGDTVNGSTTAAGGIYIELQIPAMSLYNELLAPIFEVLAGTATGAGTIYDSIPTQSTLQSQTNYGKPIGHVTKVYATATDGDGSSGNFLGGVSYGQVAGSAGQSNPPGVKGQFYKYVTGKSNYTYNQSSVLTASKNIVNAILNPIDAYIQQLGAAPVSKLLELLPNLLYAFDRDRISSLLDGIILELNVDIDGWIRMGSFSACSVLQSTPDIPDGSMKHGIHIWIQGSGLAASQQAYEESHNKIMPDPLIIPGIDLSSVINGVLDGLGLDLGNFNSVLALFGGAAAYVPDLTDIETYGTIRSSATDIAGATILPTKRTDTLNNSQPRHYITADKADVLYTLLTRVLNDSYMRDIGLNLSIPDSEEAIAAVTELMIPSADYAAYTIGYTPGIVQAPYTFNATHPLSQAEGQAILDMILTALTGGELMDVNALVNDLLDGKVYTTDIFNKVKDLLLKYVGPASPIADYLPLVAELLPEIDLDQYNTWTYTSGGTFWTGIGNGDDQIDDKAEFQAALGKLVSPIAPLLYTMLFNKDLGVLDDTIIIPGYNGYENGLIPLLEGLTLTTNLQSATAVKALYDGTAAGNEAFVNAILAPVFDSLAVIAADPIGELLDRLPQMVFFLASDTALSDALKNTLETLLVLLDTVRPLYNTSDLINSYVDMLSLDGILGMLKDEGLLVVKGVDLTTVVDADLVKALVVGTITDTASVSTTAKVQCKSAVRTGYYPKLSTSQVEYFFSVLLNLVDALNTTEGLDLVYQFLGDQQIVDIVAEVLGNIQGDPDVVLDALYHLMYGPDGVFTFNTPITYGDAEGFTLDSQIRDEWWTQEHIDYTYAHADDFLNKVFKILFGKPFGSVQATIDDVIEEEESILTDLLGNALYTQSNFDMIVDLVKDYIPTIRNINVGGKSLAELLKDLVAVSNATQGTIQSLDLDVILAPFENYTSGSIVVNDETSFVNGLVQLLEPAIPVVDLLLSSSKLHAVKADSSTYIINIFGADGYKVALVPILEAFVVGLGEDKLTEVVDPATFATLDGEGQIRAILQPILYAVEQILANPTVNIFKVLPNLLYFAETNLNTCIDKLLEPVNYVLSEVNKLYFVTDPIDVALDIPALLDDVLQGLGLGLTYDALRAVVAGDETVYTSASGAAPALYIKTDSVNEAYMLTALLRLVLVSVAGTQVNVDTIMATLADNGLKEPMYSAIKQTLEDILVFITTYHKSDITGKTTYGVDVALNALFVLCFGLDTKVITPAYNKWQSLNTAIKNAYQRLLSSNSYDQAYAKNAEAFANKYFKAVVTPSEGIAQFGFIQLFLTLIAWVKKIFGLFA